MQLFVSSLSAPAATYKHTEQNIQIGKTGGSLMVHLPNFQMKHGDREILI